MGLMQKFFKWYVARHIRVFRESDGQKMNTMRGMPVLLLNTTGRKSGVERTVPLLYIQDGDDYVVCASAGGAPKNPAWYFNLEANSATSIELPGQKLDTEAIIAEGADRDDLFAKISQRGKYYAAYQKKAPNRVIPMVRLRPKV